MERLLDRSDLDITVLIPVYNEVAGVQRVLDQLLQVLDTTPASSEVIVIDDGSTDGTAEVLRDYLDLIRIVQHEENRGYGASLKSGTTVARGKWICLLDGDGTYPVERVPDLWTAVGSHDVAMVIGARTTPGARIPLVRRPAKWLLRQLASRLTGHAIEDLNSGFRIYERDRADRYLPLLPDGFSFTTTLTMAFLSDGLRVRFVPIDYYSRAGTSKIRPIRNTYEFLVLVLRTSVFFAPLRFFTPLGFTFMFLSALLVVYRALIGEAFGVTSILLFVTGLQLLALGLLADLVNRRLAALQRN